MILELIGKRQLRLTGPRHEITKLHQRGIGSSIEGYSLTVSPVEAIWLIREGLIKEFFIDGVKVGADEFEDKLIQADKDLIVKYIVFRYLFSIGFKLADMLDEGTFLFKHKSMEKMLIISLVYEEDQIKVGKLLNIFEKYSKFHVPILIAVVDRLGDIIFYEITSLE